MYTTPYGPIVDGVVVPADPQLLMADPGAGNNYPRYDIMFGLTESESFHLFPASTGMYKNSISISFLAATNTHKQNHIIMTYFTKI